MKKYKLYYPNYHEIDIEFYAKNTEDAIKIAEQHFKNSLNIVCVGYAMLYEGRRFVAEIGSQKMEQR